MPLMTQRVSFIPSKTLNCNPPYIKGRPDMLWISWRTGNKPNTQAKLRERIGMPIELGSAELFGASHKVCD